MEICFNEWANEKMGAQAEGKARMLVRKVCGIVLWSPTCEKDGDMQEIKPQTNKGSTFLLDMKCYLDSGIKILNIIPNSL